MKRVLAAKNRPNKTELRRQFTDLATKVREMSKSEFVEILNKNDFETAQNWISELDSLYRQFRQSAQGILTYFVIRVYNGDEFKGYVAEAEHIGSMGRGFGSGGAINLTYDINKARLFTSEKQADSIVNTYGLIIREDGFNDFWIKDDDTSFEYEEV